MNRRSLGGYKAAETRRAREQALRDNVAPELVALVGRVRVSGSLDERTEQLEHYAHEHPGEVTAAMQDAADCKLEQLIAARDAA